MELIVVRHGAASHNEGAEQEHTFAGSQINNDLSDQGIIDAENLSQRILESGGADLITCSKLKRSRHTAKIINSTLCARLIVFGELNEINIGDFAGKTEQEVRSLYPKKADLFYSGDIANWEYPGGEKFSDVKRRLESFIDQLKKIAEPKNRVVVVGHGMINRVLIFLYANEQKNFWEDRNYPHDRIVRLEI